MLQLLLLSVTFSVIFIDCIEQSAICSVQQCFIAEPHAQEKTENASVREYRNIIQDLSGGFLSILSSCTDYCQFYFSQIDQYERFLNTGRLLLPVLGYDTCYQRLCVWLTTLHISLVEAAAIGDFVLGVVYKCTYTHSHTCR